MGINSIRWKNKPAAPNTAYEPTLIEHVANIVTHGVSICYITLEIFNFDDRFDILFWLSHAKLLHF